MGSIEKKQEDRQYLKDSIITFLKIQWKLEKYKQIKIVQITDNIFWVISQTKNVSFFVNNKWEYLLWTADIVKSLWQKKYTNYLKKLWYKEEKDKNWYYHMINLKTWKEIKQESYEYYKIFEILWNIQLRDFWKKIYKFKWDFVKKLTDDTNIVYMALPKEDREEYINELIQSMIEQAETMVQFYTLKPIELIFLEKHNIIPKEEYNKLKKKVYSFEYIKKLIENPVWNYVEWEEKEYKINWKTYKIKTNWITEDELKLYLDLKIINKEEYELLKVILEKRNLEQEKKEHVNKTKKHISSLEDNVRSNLA